MRLSRIPPPPFRCTYNLGGGHADLQKTLRVQMLLALERCSLEESHEVGW